MTRDSRTDNRLPEGIVAEPCQALSTARHTVLALFEGGADTPAGYSVELDDELYPVSPRTFAAIIARTGLPRVGGLLSPETFCRLVVFFYPPEAEAHAILSLEDAALLEEEMREYLGPRLDGPLVEDYDDLVIITFVVALPRYHQVEEWTVSVEGDMSLVISRLAL